MADVSKIEDAAEFTDAQIWEREITAAEKSLEKFHTASPKIVRMYLAQANENKDGDEFPIYWSNVNILKASMYARMPKADVSRRFKDAQDDEGRVAGEIIERILNADMQAEYGDIDSALRHVIEDRLTVGLGQVWMRYEPTIIELEAQAEEEAYGDQGYGAQGTGAMQGPLPGTELERESDDVQGQEEPGEAPEPEERIVDEKVITDYVHWRDLLWSPARTWEEVRWVARRTWMTRSELVKRFGPVGQLVPLQSKTKTDTGNEVQRYDPWAKAGVWEIWCKTSRSVHFYVKGFGQMLENRADPLQLPNFFPCPRPMIANTSTSALIPRADYTILRRSYEELETVSERITLLEEAIRVVGAYDKSNSELATMLTGYGNKMIPCDNWAMFAEKGGIKGSVDWFPIEEVVNALTQLRVVKTDLKNELYELTGLSDIMRGATSAQETATAQQIKAQFASIRLQYMQGEFARFVQDLLCIKSEIMAAHFQEHVLIAKSMIDKSFDAPLAQGAIALLRDKRLSQYALTVAPDSMAMVDYMAEQEAAQKFMVAFASFLQQAAPLAQMQPQTLPFLLQMLGAVVSRFRFGKQVESVLDQAVTKALQTPPQPDPAAEAMKQAQLGVVQTKAALQGAQAQKAQAEARRQPAVASLDLAKAGQARKSPVVDILTAKPQQPPEGLPQ